MALNIFPDQQNNGVFHTHAFLEDVPIQISAEIARKRINFGELLNLKKGSTLEFSKLVGEPVDLMIVDPNFDNSSIAARGEIVVVNERYGIRITALARPEDKADTD